VIKDPITNARAFPYSIALMFQAEEDEDSFLATALAVFLSSVRELI
jgi:hypothetical protein